MRDAPVDPGAWLPHTSTARLLTTIERCEDGVIEAWGRVPAAHPLVRDGRAPAFLAIELGAQAAAALEAIRRADLGDAGGASAGRLVRVREARIHRTRIDVDDLIRVVARQMGTAPPLAIYRIETTVGAQPLLEATISTWRADAPGLGGG